MEIILLVLILLWFLGYITIPGIVVPRFPLFFFGGRPITLWDILIFLVIIWAIEAAPSPFRQIFTVLVILWLLSTLGLIGVVGFSSIVVLALIIGLVISILGII